MDGPVISMGGQITGGNGAAPEGELIKDSDTRSFMDDVVQASSEVPVIVDFWAPWCGPCKQLGPVLEKAVREANGKVRLVKVNIDENQALAGQMRVQSIPAVYAFVNGQPVDGFMGMQPESEIRAFIDRLGGPSSEEQQIEQLCEAAKAALEDKNFTAAGQMFASVLQVDRENTAAIGGLARCQIETGDLEGARATLALVPPAKESDADVAGARAALELAETPSDEAEITQLRAKIAEDAKDHQSRFDLASALNAAGNREEALEHLMEIIKLDRNWNDEAARKQLLKFFKAWGLSDELTVSGRRQLSAILFS